MLCSGRKVPFEKAKIGWRVLEQGQNRVAGPPMQEDKWSPEKCFFLNWLVALGVCFVRSLICWLLPVLLVWWTPRFVECAHPSGRSHSTSMPMGPEAWVSLVSSRLEFT